MGDRNFLVQRDSLGVTDFVLVEAAYAEKAGEVVLDVDRFALTANNITYGVAGDMLGYWQFFPAPEGWGRIPVWGIGTVVESRADGISAGERFYGYFPMSSRLKVQATRVTATGFVDGADNRSALSPVYNQYSRMVPENGFDPAFDNEQMVYRPLFTTSFVLDDWLADNGFFGASTIVIGSASSKTGFGLAYQLKQRDGIEIVGLTSVSNRAFVKSLGLYDDVVVYDEIDSLDATVPTAYVDMSGNTAVLVAVHEHLRDNLKCSCGVGVTHYDALSSDRPATLPGAEPAMFFAPDQIRKRHKEWGTERYDRELGTATNRFFSDVSRWVTIEEHPFLMVDSVYHQVLAGIEPNRAIVVTSASD